MSILAGCGYRPTLPSAEPFRWHCGNDFHFSDLHLVDRMIRITHELDEELCTVKHPLFALTPCVSAPECSVSVFEIESSNRRPYSVHLFRWKRDLS